MNNKKAFISIIAFLCILNSLSYVSSQRESTYVTTPIVKITLSREECSKLFGGTKILRDIQIKTQLISGEEFKCTQSCYYYENGVVNIKLVGPMSRGYVQDLKKGERKPLRSACNGGEDRFYVEINAVKNQQQILKQFSDKKFDLASIPKDRWNKI